MCGSFTHTNSLIVSLILSSRTKQKNPATDASRGVPSVLLICFNSYFPLATSITRPTGLRAWWVEKMNCWHLSLNRDLAWLLLRSIPTFITLEGLASYRLPLPESVIKAINRGTELVRSPSEIPGLLFCLRMKRALAQSQTSSPGNCFAILVRILPGGKVGVGGE